MLIVKVKKFGVVWYIPFEMTAKSARGGTVRYPPPPPPFTGGIIHFFSRKKQKSKKISLPEESMNVTCKIQEVWSCLVHSF